VEVLRGSAAVLPVVNPNAEAVWHLFVVKVPARDHVQARLNEQGIAAGVHYPVPLHWQPAYRHLKIAEDALPVTERVAASIISLPMYPELSQDQITTVTRTLIDAIDIKSAQISL
jgi:dTDP-4-amino-4,6-dideoxygalactose transaminase